MKLIHSICTNLYFPASRKDISAFRDMAHFLSDKGVRCIEFYHDGKDHDKVGNVLQDTGLNGVYIAVIPSKEKKLHLCNEDAEGRKAAVDFFKDCIDDAAGNGIGELMINSGAIGKNIEAGLDALAASFEELYDYISVKNYSLKLLMEPCDSHMDARQLIGPYRRTLDFVKRLHKAGLPLQLTMDTAHTVEEGENFLEALTAVKQYCNQIHFANCHIRNPENPLYGDKHLGFEYPDTEWTVSALSLLFSGLQMLYPGDEPLRIGLEVLCREPDPYAYFNNAWNSLTFLHEGLLEDEK